MKRIIEFRGKSVDTGEWVYGSYMYWNDNTGSPIKHSIKERHFIYAYSCPDFNLGGWSEILVDPSTIGQYTGLKDKNGKKIFEGDIFTLGSERILYIVEWIDIGLKGRQNGNSSTVGLSYWKNNIEVVGNIHDNPELLEV